MRGGVLASAAILGVAFILIFTTGCASVRNLDADGNKIGFEHFAGKHYLVLEPLKDGGHQLKVLTLPDLSQPGTIKYKSGWGSVQFSFKLQNGVLSDFGNARDMKGAETLAAVGAAVGTLGTAYAGVLAATITAGAAVTTQSVDGPTAEAPELVIDSLQESANLLRTEVVDPLSQIKELVPIANEIYVQAGVLEGIAQLDITGEIIAQIIEAQEETLEVATELEKADRELRSILDMASYDFDPAGVVRALTVLGEQIRTLKNFALSEKQPIFFEILPRADGSGIEFRRVNLGEL